MNVKKATTAQLRREVTRLEKELKRKVTRLEKELQRVLFKAADIRRRYEAEKARHAKVVECFNELNERGLLRALVDVRSTYKATYTEHVEVYIQDCTDVLDCEEHDLATSVKVGGSAVVTGQNEARREARLQAWSIVQKIQSIVKAHKLTTNVALRRMINDHLNGLEDSSD